MVENIVKKASSRIKFLYRHQNCLNRNVRKMLGNALVQCHFDYCLSSWYNGINKNLKHKLQVTQNRLVRFILNQHPRQHLDQSMLDSIGFLKMDNRAAQLILNHMFNIQKSTAPKYLSQFFNNISNVHSYNTRHSKHNYAMHQVSGPTKATFYHNATKLWNSLPIDIKTRTSKDSFKVSLKKHLAQKARLEEQSTLGL